MDLTSQKDVCSPAMFLGELCTARTRHPCILKKKLRQNSLRFIEMKFKTTVILLMEEILHELVSSLSHCLQGLYTPGGAGVPPKKNKKITILFRQSFKLYIHIYISHTYIYIYTYRIRL